MNDVDTLHQERQEHKDMCVPRGQWHEAGARESEGVSELPFELVLQSEHVE